MQKIVHVLRSAQTDYNLPKVKVKTDHDSKLESTEKDGIKYNDKLEVY